MIALELAGEPSVLIADESTSALDAIATDQILSLLEATQRRQLTTLLLDLQRRLKLSCFSSPTTST